MESLAIIEAVASHAAASGHFDVVNQSEPKSAPGNQLVCSIWVQSIGPHLGSGLASTSARFTVNVRVYTPFLAADQQAQDMIDVNVMKAVDALMAAYSGDFTLDGLIREVDLLGEGGTALSAEAGYVEIDRVMFRVMTITVPMIVDDVWTQVA